MEAGPSGIKKEEFCNIPIIYEYPPEDSDDDLPPAQKRRAIICTESEFESEGNELVSEIKVEETQIQECDGFIDNSIETEPLQVKHSEEEQFECDMCGEKFKISANLSAHFKCDDCGVVFVREGELKRHHTIAHSPRIDHQSGKILHMKLKDFMCHKNYESDFNQYANVLVGPNGSGKTAILRALVIGLSSNENPIDGSNSTKELIRHGASSATIEVHLSNDGRCAYKPKKYGSKIIVICKINKSGRLKYTLKNGPGTGDIVSRNRADLLDLVSGLSIQVDNPICVITQEKFRKYILDANSKERYELFWASLSKNDDTNHIEKKRSSVGFNFRMQTMRVLKFGYTAELKFDDQERTLDISMEIQGINHEFTELSVDHRSALTAAFLLALKRQVFRRIFFIDFPEVLKDPIIEKRATTAFLEDANIYQQCIFSTASDLHHIEESGKLKVLRLL